MFLRVATCPEVGGQNKTNSKEIFGSFLCHNVVSGTCHFFSKKHIYQMLLILYTFLFFLYYFMPTDPFHIYYAY